MAATAAAQPTPPPHAKFLKVVSDFPIHPGPNVFPLAVPRVAGPSIYLSLLSTVPVRTSSVVEHASRFSFGDFPKYTLVIDKGFSLCSGPVGSQTVSPFATSSGVPHCGPPPPRRSGACFVDRPPRGLARIFPRSTSGQSLLQTRYDSGTQQQSSQRSLSTCAIAGGGLLWVSQRAIKNQRARQFTSCQLFIIRDTHLRNSRRQITWTVAYVCTDRAHVDGSFS